MRQKPVIIALFAAGSILLTVVSGWAGQSPASGSTRPAKAVPQRVERGDSGVPAPVRPAVAVPQRVERGDSGVPAPVRPAKPTSVANYILGYNAELLGQADEALGYYESALREDGSSTVVRMRLATLYAQLERFPDARREVKKVLQMAPEDLGAHYLLAMLYSRAKDEKSAAGEFELIFKTLAARNPENSEFPRYLGQLYYSTGNESAAMEQFALSLNLDPKNAALLYILGTYYLDGPRRVEGLGLIKQCLVLEPVNVDCLNSLAYAYAEDNVNLDEGVKSVNLALQAEPDNPAYLDTRGWLYYRLGRYDEALKELIRADSFLKDPEILGHIAQVYLKLGATAEAQKYQQEKEQFLDAQHKRIN